MTAMPIPDTFWTTQQELMLFGGSCLIGIPSGLLLDCFRLMRRMVRHPALAVAAEDVLWIVGTAGMLLLYASACARGVFRVYYAAGCLIGCILYEVTLGRPAVRLLSAVWNALLSPLRRLGQAAAMISTKMIDHFVRIAKKTTEGKEITQKTLQESVEKVYNNNRYPEKGSRYGKDKTTGRPSAFRRAAAPADRIGAVHRRVCGRFRQDAEFDRREEKGTGRTERKY